MQEQILENEFLSVRIAAAGAELQSLFHKQTLTEYLWQGDAHFWAKRSPVLFPIVGGLQNNLYTHNGKEYPLMRHGFARDLSFVPEVQNPHECWYVLADSPASRAIYPFAFTLMVGYRLENNAVVVQYKVQNGSNETMYFSLGAHPAFSVPLAAGTSFADYYIEFPEDDKLQRYLLNNEGLLSGVAIEVPLQAHRLALSEALFAKDALVLKQRHSSTIRIGSKWNDRFVALEASQAQWPFYGIWSKPGAPFVCLEPWCGIASTAGAGTEVSSKEGIMALAPGEWWQNEFTVRVG